MTSSLSGYSVSKIKTIRGMEGHGYSCDLLCNGKKVAECVDDASGASLHVYWLDKAPATVTTRDYKDEPHTYAGTVEEAAFHAVINALPMLPADESTGCPAMYTSIDIVVDDMVNYALAIKKIAADFKKQITIQTADGKFVCYKPNATWPLEKLSEVALKRNPGAKVLNSMSLESVYALYKEANLV